MVGESEIHVVATEKNMVADGNARKLQVALLLRHGN
jgi:hypothetical protein